MPWFQWCEPTISWKENKLNGNITLTTESKTNEINATTMATSWAIQGSQPKDKEKKPPAYYKEYHKVFSEEEAK